MKKSVIFQIMFCILLLVGCQSEDVVKGSQEFGNHSLEASIEGHKDANASRTAVDENGNVTWIHSDELGVYGNQTQNAKYVSTGSGSSVTFTGNLDSDTDEAQWAYYPYEEDASLTDGVLSLNLPSEYEYTGNSNAPMIGRKMGSNKLAFKHLSGLIRFTLGGGMPKNADRFVITSKGENQPIAGQVSFDVDTENTMLVITGEGKQQITYRLDNIQVVEEFQHFFVPLPVGTYDKLEVAFYLKDSETPVFTRSISNLNVKRAQMVSMPILNWNTGEQYILGENTMDISDLTKGNGITVTLEESNNSLHFKGLDESCYPEIGQVIWSKSTDELPYGFMGKVKEITQIDGTTTIETESAALDEVFDNLLINETVPLMLKENGSRSAVLDKNPSLSLALDISDDKKCYSASGGVDLGIHLIVFIELDKNKKSKNMKITMETDAEFHMDMSVKTTYNDNGDVGKYPLASKTFAPVSLGYCVWIFPEIQANFYGVPKGEIDFNTSFEYKTKGYVGFEYLNGNCISRSNGVKLNEPSPFNLHSTIAMSGSFFTGIGLEFNAKFYNQDDMKISFEPQIGIDLTGEIGIDSSAENIQESLKDAHLTMNNVLKASAGIDASIIADQLAVSFDMEAFKWDERKLYLLPLFENLAAETKAMTSGSRASIDPFEATVSMIGSRELLSKDTEVTFVIEDMVENYKSHSREVMKYDVMGGGKTSQNFSTTFSNLNSNNDYRAYPMVMSPVLGEELNYELELTEQYVTIQSPTSNLRQQLIQLYNSAGGENWTHKENWLTDEAIEHWEGVHRNSDGKYSIELRDNNLSGTVSLSSPDIRSIDVSNNQIENLSLSGCTGLEYAEYGNNPLLILDLSDCSIVSGYYSMGDENTYSKIKQLKMNNCMELTDMFIEMPMLESLDLNGCEKLQDMSIVGETLNRLTAVNLSGCKEISDLAFLDNAPIKYLNISGCEKITYLRPLSVNMPRVIEELYAVNCTGLTGQVGILPTMRILDLENCTSLESVAYNSAVSDEYQLTSLNVKGCTSMEWFATPRNVYLQEFNMAGCKQLKEVEVYLSDNITNVDLSEFTLLEEISIYGDQLQSLDVTHCPALKSLSFSGDITTIDLSNNRELEYLNTSQSLTELDLTYNHELKELFCGYGNIKSLDLADKRKLERVSCGGEHLEFLDVRGCFNLKSLDCTNGQLTTLDVSDSEILETLHCNNNKLTALDVTNNPNLTSLFCHDNAITELNVDNNLNLKYLRCENNQIKVLDVKNHALLEDISCSNSTLETLDVNGCAKITSLRLSGCPNLSSLNFTGCSSISDMYLYDTGLTGISLSGMTSLTDFSCNDNAKLTSLDLTGCTNLVTLDCAVNPELAELTLMSRAPLTRIHFDGTKVTHEIPSWFPLPNSYAGIYFTYEQRYTDYQWVTNVNGTKTLTWKDNGFGWWYPGEPTKGRHSRD